MRNFDGDVDYSEYTLRELQEALEVIDRNKYPQNYKNLCIAYASLTSSLPPEPENAPSEPGFESRDDDPRPRYDEHGRYIPNTFSTAELLWSSVFSVFIICYGAYGALRNDIYIPGKRSSGMHFHDQALVLVLVAMGFAAVLMFLTIVDHFDKRDNERSYKKAATVCTWLAGGFFIAAAVVSAAAN